MTPRSFLYVPADGSDRLAKAHTRGADAIIADLDDAVASSEKDTALTNVEEWLSTRSVRRKPRLWVRIHVASGAERRRKGWLDSQRSGACLCRRWSQLAISGRSSGVGRGGA
jgi:hypothetical protein